MLIGRRERPARQTAGTALAALIRIKDPPAGRRHPTSRRFLFDQQKKDKDGGQRTRFCHAG